MGTEVACLGSAVSRAARAAALCVAGLVSRPAIGAPPAWLGLADLRGAPVVYGPADAPPPASTRLQLMVIAPTDPAPHPRSARCCLLTGQTVPPAGASSPADTGTVAEVLTWPTSGGDPVPAPRSAARATGAARRLAPAVALVGTRPGLKATAAGAGRWRLSWPSQPQPWRLDTCTTAEGLRVEFGPLDGSQPVQRFYVPLGMDVEPTCR